MEWPKLLKNLHYSDNMIYEIAQQAKKAIENDCDAYEIYIDESKSIQLDSLKEELNFAKEEIERGVGIRVIKDNKIGFAFTSNMDKIAETAKQSIENTKLNKIDENYAFAEVEKVPKIDKKIINNRHRKLIIKSPHELDYAYKNIMC